MVDQLRHLVPTALHPFKSNILQISVLKIFFETHLGMPQYEKKRKSRHNVTRGGAAPPPLVTGRGCGADPP